ncbi:hypothetical protein LCGC14_1797030, partial [marine sediment metagenome]
YRIKYGKSVTKRVINLVPKVGSSPVAIKKIRSPPKNASDAKAQYSKACAKGDAVCASPLKE